MPTPPSSSVPLFPKGTLSLPLKPIPLPPQGASAPSVTPALAKPLPPSSPAPLFPKGTFSLPLKGVPPPPPPALRPRFGGRSSTSHTPPTTTIRRDGGTKGVFALLYEDRGRKVIAGLINQIKINRSELPGRLNALYQGMPGTPLEEEDVMRVIQYHNIGDSLYKRESDVVCRNLLKQRGSLAKTAQKLKMDPDQLKAKITELGLDAETSKIRAKFKEEVLGQTSFNERLDLALTREKYLSDLEIEKEVDDSLRRELDVQISQWTAGAISEAGAKAVREALSLDEEKFRRLLKRFGLEASFPADEPGPSEERQGNGPGED